MFKNILKACRPKQWTKNFIVFAGPAFNFNYSNNIFQNSIISVICFCLISSSIYLLNYVLDINSDRQHPIKKFRPIASGRIKIPLALALSFIIAFTSFLASYFLISGYFPLIILGYYLIQIFYCIKLKKEPILDLLCISTGFILRALAGIVACNLPFSPWFLLTIGMLSLFLARLLFIFYPHIMSFTCVSTRNFNVIDVSPFFTTFNPFCINDIPSTII